MSFVHDFFLIQAAHPPLNPIRLTFEQWAEAPKGDAAQAAELSEGNLQEKHGEANKEEHDQVREEESSC